MSDRKKKKIKKLVKDMLVESHKKAVQNIDKVLSRNCVDIDGWDEENAPMILPKTILTAILENEARQYTARGTKYERQMKKEQQLYLLKIVKNMNLIFIQQI